MATDIKTRTKAANALQRDGRFAMVIKQQGEVNRGRTVRFGGVTVVAPKPDERDLKKQIAEGKRAVTQLKKALGTPGVKITQAAGTPVFHADPGDASMVIRVLNGKSMRGRFVRDQFIPAPTR